MNAMKKLSFYFALFLLPISIFCQNVNVPTLEYVQLIQDRNTIFTITLNYDSENSIVFQIADKSSNEIDSLKPFVLDQLRNLPTYKQNLVIIELILDKKFRLWDLELIQEELKRLGLRKIFYSSNSQNEMENEGEKKTGIIYSLPFRDEKRI